MKVLIVSGFLGSGKTTLINRLMKNEKKDYLIMENEFASVNVDADFLENDREKIWEMTEGCICCSMNADMGRSVLTVANSYKPEVLIIEPTGIGKLSQILHSVSRVEYEKIEILPPISTVDALCFWDYMRKDDPFYEDQIKYAAHIFITKTKDLAKAEVLGISAKIKHINPNAELHIEGDIKDGDQIWNEVLNSKEKQAKISMDFSAAEHPELEQIAFVGIEDKSIDEMAYKLNLLLRGTFGEVIRLKGFLPINEQWTRVDIVAKRYSLETIDEKPESKLVIIGKDLDKTHLKELFENGSEFLNAR